MYMFGGSEKRVVQRKLLLVFFANDAPLVRLVQTNVRSIAYKFILNP